MHKELMQQTKEFHGNEMGDYWINLSHSKIYENEELFCIQFESADGKHCFGPVAVETSDYERNENIATVVCETCYSEWKDAPRNTKNRIIEAVNFAWNKDPDCFRKITENEAVNKVFDMLEFEM